MSRAAPVLALALAVASLLAGAARPAPAPSPRLVIAGDRAVAGVRLLAPRPALVARLGPADRVRRIGPYNCRLVWRRLGLSALLLDLTRRAPCRDGAFQSATVTSRAWRTVKGLRVRDGVPRLRRLYPHARLRDGFLPHRGWWLVPRRACAEVGAPPYPGLLARVRQGRVSALVVLVAACE